MTNEDVLKHQLDRALEENYMLREQLAQIKKQLVTEDWWPWAKVVGITPAQEQILRALYKLKDGVVTIDRLMVVQGLHRPEAELTSPTTTAVQISRLRRLIPPDSILNVWGRGYTLSPAGRAWIDHMCGKLEERTDVTREQVSAHV
jgi:DNA-binding response OmpR family regulator